MNKKQNELSNNTQLVIKKNPYMLITGEPGKGRSFMFPNLSEVVYPKN